MHTAFALWLVMFCTMSAWAGADSTRVNSASIEEQPITAERIMQKVFSYAERNEFTHIRYTSDVYVRHRMHTRRRGQIVRYLPQMFRLERGSNEYMSEAELQFQYRPPGETDCKVKAFHTTARYLSPERMNSIARFNFQIYDTRLFTDNLLNPLHRRNRRFYKYALRYTSRFDSVPVVHIEIMPRFDNEQLVKSGFIDVDIASGRVCNFRFTMRRQLQNFTVSGRPGRESYATLLPEQLRILVKFRLLGNRVDEVYDISARHVFSCPTDTDATERSTLDLTRLCLLRIDTTSIINSRTYFEHIRPFPLRGIEQRIYHTHDSLAASQIQSASIEAQTAEIHRALEPYFAAGADTVSIPIPIRQNERRNVRQQTGDVLLSSHTFNIGQQESAFLRLPAVITPSMVQWSGSKGLSLQTRIGFTVNILRWEGALRFTPRVGYSFKQKQVYWNLPMTLNFWPRTNGVLNIEANGGDHIYSNRQAEDVRKSLKGVEHYDSLMHILNNYGFFYYRNFRLKAELSFSPTPGLRITAGARYYKRTLLQWNETAASAGMERVLSNIAPVLVVEYTPRQHYYRQGLHRVPLYSVYPTFTLNYERGYAIGKAQTAYERIEGDIRYRLPLYAMRTLFFRVGGGAFTQRNADCFLDYDYFRFNNMPNGWNDEMTGEFQLLNSQWYNESRYYALATATYESPMLLFSRLPFLSRFFQKERVYAGFLSVHSLGFYSEWGYGLSTNIVDLGAFVSFSHEQKAGFGIKCVLRFFDN